MSDSTPPRSTVAASATVIVRQPPSLLLMVARVRSAKATLELGLADAKQQAADAARRLARLGATKVWSGEPHTDDHAQADPMARMQPAAMARHLPPGSVPARRRGVNVAVMATWDLAGKSAEEVLLLVDRLRFDAAANVDDPDAAETPGELPPWADPEEHLKQMMARAAEPPPEDCAPKFVYIARPGEDQLVSAMTEAYQSARQKAERLAAAAGKRLGELASIHSSYPATDVRPDRMMEQQRCRAVLAAGGYQLPEEEALSEDPRAAEIVIAIHVTHNLV